MDADVVDGHARQGHGDAHQRVDGVAVERHHDQEDAAHAVDDGEEQGELQVEQRDTVTAQLSQRVVPVEFMAQRIKGSDWI